MTPARLSLTGERTLPGIPDEAYWFTRHVVAYRLAAARARGFAVLDAGCGEGYGAAALHAAGARWVVAVDVDPAVVAHLRRNYPQLESRQAELGDLPYPDGTFDLVVSLQVIEHVWDVPAYLTSLRRVLAPGGELVVATPNRLTFSPGSNTPVNPFHVREFTAVELRQELDAAGFRTCGLLGVHHGPLLRAVEAALGRPLPDVLGDGPPETWDGWVRRVVHRVRPTWFRVRADRLDASLDLIAVCRAGRR